MAQYKKYKDSGVGWIGMIPRHWEVKKIKYTTYVKGRIGWQNLRAEDFIEEGPFLITGTEFNKGRITWDDCHHVDNARYDMDPFIQVKNKDILITKDGTIGKVAIVESLPGKATLNTGIFVTRPYNNNYEPKYMFWLLQSNVFRGFIDFHKAGATIVHLYQNVFNDFTFPLPSKNEQHAIAAYLDKKTTAIDKLIQEKEALLEKLRQTRQSIINETVTQGLDPHAEMKDSGIAWIGKIPKHWEVKKLKYVGEIVLGKMLCNEDKGGYYLKPYLKSKNVEWENVNLNNIEEMWFSEEELINYRLKKSDLVMCEGGEVGRTAIWKDEIEECYLQNSVHKITFHEGLNPIYFLFYFECLGSRGEFKKIVNQVSIAHLTREKLINIVCIVPTKEDQDKIVEFISSRSERLKKAECEIATQIEKLRAYRQSLITEVVTGKLKVI